MPHRPPLVSHDCLRLVGKDSVRYILGAVAAVVVIVGGCAKSGMGTGTSGGGSGGHSVTQAGGGRNGSGIGGSASVSGGASATGDVNGGGGMTVGGTGGRGSGGVSGSGGSSGNAGGSGSGAIGATSGLGTGGEFATTGSGSGGVIGNGGSSSGGTGGRGGGGVAGNGGAGGSGGASGTVGRGGGGTTGSYTGGTGGTGGSAGVGGTGGRAGSGGTGGTGGTGGGTDVSLATLASAFCAAARACCTKAALPMALDDCETMFPSRIATLALVNKGTVTIDSTALAACVAAYRLVATACVYAPLVTGCSGVFVGTKAESAPCGVGGNPFTPGRNECRKSGGAELCVWTGDSTDPTVTGACHKAPRGGKGDACASSCPSGQDCSADFFTSPGTVPVLCFEDDGLYCNWATSSGTCAPIVAQGGSCAVDPSECASNTYCDSTAATPVCKAAGTLGQSCTLSGSTCLSQYVCGANDTCVDPDFAYESTCTGSPPVP